MRKVNYLIDSKCVWSGEYPDNWKPYKAGVTIVLVTKWAPEYFYVVEDIRNISSIPDYEIWNVEIKPLI